MSVCVLCSCAIDASAVNLVWRSEVVSNVSYPVHRKCAHWLELKEMRQATNFVCTDAFYFTMINQMLTSAPLTRARRALIEKTWNDRKTLAAEQALKATWCNADTGLQAPH